MITESDACEIIQLAMKAGIGVRLDGGWGIEALIGRQTRPHDVMLLCEKYGFDVPDEYRE